ncbi:PilZ domain-containing protein [Sphingorhabdus sp. SMR4y]|uniref:PilZ domain-containing protein n=1 Tax=Sphingorhabdus sp. SMR4y TaxID=2584094 RepID=UPI000B5CF677|nr:PilZ domain-containing protein [Sphingorhabdus sp. SMR4y]ASK89766.1 PilZ domain protein [Sphingorhabdus sp. SMR4y]
MGYMNSQFRTVEPALIEQRKAFRHPVQIQRTAIRQHGKTARQGELVDLSIYGCRVASDSMIAEGSRIWLRFADSNPISATAIWCRDGHVGCRFDETLDQKLFRRLTLICE